MALVAYKPNKHKLFARKSTVEKVVYGVVFVIFTLYAATLLFPLVWGLISSLKTPFEYYEPFSLPAKPLFSNYLNAIDSLGMENMSMLEMLWNSIWFSVGSTIITVLCTSITAYVMSKYRFRGRRFVYSLFIIVLVFPIYGSFPAQYRLMYNLHVVDSYLILFTAIGAISFNLLIMMSFYDSLSWSYAESAMIDGAGPLKIYHRVMLPQATSMVLAIFLMVFIGNWNNYLSPILYLPSRLTLSAGLFMFQEVVTRQGNYPEYFAASFMLILPVFILYCFLANTIMTNLSIGGLKG